MKKTLLILSLILLLVVPVWAGPPAIPPSASIGATINDSAGDGDTTETYSADKIVDLLALKQAAGSYLTATAFYTTSYDASTWNGVVDKAVTPDVIRDYLESRMPTGSDGTYGLLLTNNTSRTPTASSYELYADGGVWKMNTNGTESVMTNASSSDTFTNKTIDVDGTGNVVKSWGYLILTHPHVCGSAAPMQTTSTANTFGQCKFADDSEANNFAEYYLVVPADIDLDVDLVATFKFKLGGADTGDHDYLITFDSVADSAAYAGSLGDGINLAYTADGSGADGDVETATGTLTGWRAAMTAGQLMVIRVTRDGDDGTNDTSTVDSYSGPLVIKYKITQ